MNLQLTVKQRPPKTCSTCQFKIQQSKIYLKKKQVTEVDRNEWCSGRVKVMDTATNCVKNIVSLVSKMRPSMLPRNEMHFSFTYSGLGYECNIVTSLFMTNKIHFNPINCCSKTYLTPINPLKVIWEVLVTNNVVTLVTWIGLTNLIQKGFWLSSSQKNIITDCSFGYDGNLICPKSCKHVLPFTLNTHINMLTKLIYHLQKSWIRYMYVGVKTIYPCL